MVVVTGPEHYLKAEQLLTAQAGIAANHDETNPAAALMLAEAQVHATLALAAATALNLPGGDGAGMLVDDYEQWEIAASAKGGAA